MIRKITIMFVLVSLLMGAALPWFDGARFGIKMPWCIGWLIATMYYCLLLYSETLIVKLREHRDLLISNNLTLMKRNNDYVKTLDAMAKRDVKK